MLRIRVAGILLCIAVLGSGVANAQTSPPPKVSFDMRSLYAFSFAFDNIKLPKTDYRLIVYNFSPSAPIWFHQPQEPRTEAMVFATDQRYSEMVTYALGCAISKVEVSWMELPSAARESVPLGYYTFPRQQLFVEKKSDGTLSSWIYAYPIGAPDEVGRKHSVDGFIPSAKRDEIFSRGKMLFEKGKESLGLAAFCPNRAAAFQIETEGLIAISLRSKDNRLDYWAYGLRDKGTRGEVVEIRSETGFPLFIITIQRGRKPEITVIKNELLPDGRTKQISVRIPVAGAQTKSWQVEGRIYPAKTTFGQGSRVEEFKPSPKEARQLVKTAFSLAAKSRQVLGVKRISPVRNIRLWF